MLWISLLLLHALAADSSAGGCIKECRSPISLPRRGDVRRRPAVARAAFASPSAALVGGHRISGQRRSVVTHRLGVSDTSVDAALAASAGADALEEDASYVDRGLRFSGVGRLYANQDAATTVDTVLDRLHSATVAVIGIGGVGSWAAESLCRSGVGHLILVDLDDICISNTNRQLHATSSAVGKMKIDEMGTRLRDINPACNVTLVHDFVTVDNANAMVRSIMPEVTACIDAIDGMQEKTALMLACVANGIPIVTCGGAAGRTDPTKIVVDDLTKVQEDRLLFKCRKLLRQKHGFPKVPMPGQGRKSRVRKWRIPAVYSTEIQQRVVAGEANADNGSSFRTCDGALGTACFVTGTYGFVAAGKVVEMISQDQLVAPKRQGDRR